MKKFLALYIMVILAVAVAPAFAVIPMGPDPGIQEPGPLYDGNKAKFPLLEYLTAAPAYAESDSDSREFNPPGEVEEEPKEEAPVGGTLFGVAIILGFLYLIDKRAKKKGKPGLLERFKKLLGSVGKVFHKRE